MIGDAPININVRTAVGIVAALLIGGYAVLSLTLSSIVSDVSDIKTRLFAAQTSAQTAETKGVSADADIRLSLSNIDKNVAVMANEISSFKEIFGKSLDSISTDVAKLYTSSEKLSAQFEAINVRLVRIEEKVGNDGTFTKDKMKEVPNQTPNIVPDNKLQLPSPQP